MIQFLPPDPKILQDIINDLLWRVIKYFLPHKSTLLTGPIASGKTTFLRYIYKKEIPEGPSGAPRTYKVEDAIFNVVTDMSGDEAYLSGCFDEYIKKHDYIMFFFDVTLYLNDKAYREDVNARIEMINRNARSSKSTLLVGTHIDKAPNGYKVDVEKMLAGKPYKEMMKKMVYVNTTQKECVKSILDELQKS